MLRVVPVPDAFPDSSWLRALRGSQKFKGVWRGGGLGPPPRQTPLNPCEAPQAL